MRWTLLTAALALAMGLAVPSEALAAGGPVAPVQGGAIGVAGSPYRYAALATGSNTTVKRLAAGTGHVVSELRVSGRYGVPGVDYSGQTTGLSANGRTLVLAELLGNGVPRTTRLLVLDTRRLVVRARLALPGWSTVDAISPDGRWLYLIHYQQSDITRYAVLAYDLPARRLLAQPVVDPRDRGEAMTGLPITRVMSADGRWAYTLYSRPSGVPFVHALDTAGHRAVCIDLPSLSNVYPGNAQLLLTPGGSTLQVATGGVTEKLINTRTFALTSPRTGTVPAPLRPAPRERGNARGGRGAPWELIVPSLALLAALAVAAARRGKPRRRPGCARAARAATFGDLKKDRPDQTEQHAGDRSVADDEVPVP